MSSLLMRTRTPDVRDAEQILKAKDRPRMVRWPQSLDELGDIEPAIREYVCNVTVPPGRGRRLPPNNAGR